MPTEIYDNLDLAKTAHLDGRLESVDLAVNLPDLSVTTNFIYEGAKVYVTGEMTNYQAQDDPANPGTLIWVNIGGVAVPALVTGSITILPSTTILDLSSVYPAIALCDSVVIDISGGSSVNLNSIVNFPSEVELTFYVKSGQVVTFKHSDYDNAGANDIVLEDGFDMELVGRIVGNESLILKNHGGVLCQWGATQFVKKDELNTALLNIVVEDNLTSLNTTTALSAFQGKVLKDLVDTKQDILVPGTHIDIDPNTNDIKALPWAWQGIPAPLAAPTSAESYLVGLPLVVSDNYFFSDLRVFNMGLWFLPVGLSNMIIGNWINMDAPVTAVQVARYDVVGDYNIVSATDYVLKVNPSSLHGSDIGATFNPDGPNNEKVSCLLPLGKYKIDLTLDLLSDHINDFETHLFLTNGLILDSAGAPLTVNVMSDNVVTSVVNQVHVKHKIHYYFEVTVVGQHDALTFTLPTTTDYTNLSINNNYQSYLEITKIQ